MPYRPTHGSCVIFAEDSTVAQIVSRETLPYSKPSTCRGSIRINHNSKDRTGETATRIRIRDKGGVTISIIKTIKGMDGGIIRTICHQTELMKHPLRRS